MNKTKNHKKQENCIAKSRLFPIEETLELDGLFDGKLYHLSFDCPKNLALAFKQETRDNGTSICKELQKYMLSYVSSARMQKTAFGNTISRVLKPSLTIENLNFEQYCQTRPRRYVRNVEPVDVTRNLEVACEVAGCRNAALSEAVYLPRDELYRVCEVHLSEFRRLPKEWKVS
jgi:hypothetical protein